MKTCQQLTPHPVILLPSSYPVFDLSTQKEAHEVEKFSFGIGRYREKRTGMYTTPIYKGKRDIHMGIDFFCPVGQEVFSFEKGEVFLFGNNDSPGDYGGTLITRHLIHSIPIYALYGHLSLKSLQGKASGQSIQRGDVLGWVGDRHENGGWTPHLHFQLSYEMPTVPDFPGVVSEADFESALQKFPDPRIVLGPVYL